MCLWKIHHINFYVPNSLTRWRAQILFIQKNQGTIKWINGFKKNEIFWDIGSNIGIYSLYASKKKVKVFAFEPSPINFHVLTKNIFFNQQSKNISPHCVCLCEKLR